MTACEVAKVFRAKRVGRGKYIAKCTAHRDSTPSLSIAEGKLGVLMYCWAGCNINDVLKSSGLSIRDLFYQNPQYKPQPWDVRNLAAEADRCVSKVYRLWISDAREKERRARKLWAQAIIDPDNVQLAWDAEDALWKARHAMEWIRPLFRREEVSRVEL